MSDEAQRALVYGTILSLALIALIVLLALK
jgi:hypothetical protein